MYPKTPYPLPRLSSSLQALVLVLGLFAALLVPHLPLPSQTAPPAPQEPTPRTVVSALGRLPLAFVPGTGQNPRVQFEAQALGGSAAFTAEGVLLALPAAPGQPPVELHVTLIGARPGIQIEGREPKRGVVNRYQGNDPARWQTGLPTYAALVYPQLYPGISLRYDGNGAHLKGTYELAPGADPARIRWRYHGAEEVRLDPTTGDLHLTLPSAQVGVITLIERAPVAWQEVDGQQRDVPVHYIQAPDGSLGFGLGAYDPALPLIIDPTLEHGAYLGGTASEEVRDIAVDANGNIILLGFTTSPEFPGMSSEGTSPNRQNAQVFVTKLNPAGTEQIFSTLFGGSEEEQANALALDDSGQIAVVGATLSSDLALRRAIYPASLGDYDAFVAVFNAEGALQFSTYLGGSSYDAGKAVAFDREGRIVVAGGTGSDNFPTVAALQNSMRGLEDVFIAKFNTQGTALEFSTYLGGSESDTATALAIDPSSRNIIITGATDSPNFPLAGTLRPAFGGVTDAFVLGLAPDGSTLQFSTYLGGSQPDSAAALAVDQAGNIYLTGQTTSDNFPTAKALQQSRAGPGSDAFVASLTANGTTWRFITYLGGGQGEDAGRDIALGANGEIVVAGATDASDFPQAASSLQRSNNGVIDLFVSRLSADGARLRFSTYLGGTHADFGALLAIDQAQHIIIAGNTYSDNVIVDSFLQPLPSGSGDMFLARINSHPRLRMGAKVSHPAVSPCTAIGACPTVQFEFTLSAVDGDIPADLTIWVPPGLNVREATLSAGAFYSAQERLVQFKATITPDAPATIRYHATLLPTVLPGAVLTTYAKEQGLDPNVQAVLPVAVAQPNFKGTLVAIYASGDNNLAGAMQRLLLNAARGSTNPDVRTLLLLDGPGTDDTTLYHLGPGAAGCINPAGPQTCPGVERWRWPTDLMANRQNLTAFLSSALGVYPKASRRVLSLVGHGGGWSPPVLEGQPSGHGSQPSDDPLGGMLWDKHTYGALSTPELAQALRDATSQTNTTFDLLFLDACSMAMAEVAYEVRDSARYLLASANWKWAGFPYDQHIPSAVGDGRAIGLAWLRQEANELRRWDTMPFTYALIDLSKMEELRSATDGLATALMRGPLSTAEGRQALLSAAGAADHYDSNGDGALQIDGKAADNYVDLGGLALQLTQVFSTSQPVVAQQAQALAAVLNQAVVARDVQSGSPWTFPSRHWSWSPEASLSIYLPLHQDDWRRRYYGLIQHSKDGQWDELLARYWQSPVGSAPSLIPPAVPCALNCPLPFDQLPTQPLVYLPMIKH
ncbi:MAG: hypothetical protein OHK0022_49390 [Roseiflexaceae bacterium]